MKDLLALSSKARLKLMADSQDLEVLIRYLWVEDKHSLAVSTKKSLNSTWTNLQLAEKGGDITLSLIPL